VDGPRSKDRDVESLGINDREVDGVNNGSFSRDSTGTGLMKDENFIRMKISDHAKLHRMFHEEAE
jgi:hypothetical protein